ncbi:MAG: hypothetical protein LLG03_14070 [Planctomycetaceae bacterium]|nr:hypothetical protein [Planctomycetaceae bacterium]
MKFLYALAVAGVLAASSAPPVVPDGAPQFKSGPYSLVLTKIDVQSSIDYAQPAKTRHQIEISATMITPEKEDAVAVGKHLVVLSATNAAGEELLKPSKNMASRTYKPDTFSPVHVKNLAAEVGVDRLDLTAPATGIKTMKVATQIVLAKSRQTKRLAAVVMEEMTEAAPGLAVRIANLRMSAKRELEVTIEYQRGRAGAGFPFIEAVYALDAEGQSLGGGRWTEGDVLGLKGKFTARFPIASDEAHKTLKIVAVTEDQVAPVEFELTDIFLAARATRP